MTIDELLLILRIPPGGTLTVQCCGVPVAEYTADDIIAHRRGRPLPFSGSEVAYLAGNPNGYTIAAELPLQNRPRL